jgi:hypothetical protein
VKLSSQEKALLAAWIDLGVPFCGDYTEANLWTPDEAAMYERYLAKRQKLAAEERANIEAWLKRYGSPKK